MAFPYSVQLAAATTAVSLSALSVYPQSTRATEMDNGNTITSLTSLHSNRHASPPFGAIDASTNDSVMLDVSVAPDLAGGEIGDQLPAARASGRSSLSGSTPSQVVPHGSLPGKNPQGATGSLAVTKVFSVQKASSSMSLQGGSLHSSQGAPFESLQDASFRSSHALIAGNVSRSGSTANASPASGASGRQPYGEAHPGRDYSGVYRSTSGMYASGAYHFVPSDASGQFASNSDQFDSQPASDISPEDADTSNVDASASESSTTAADGQNAYGGFEAIGDPFGELFQGGFTGRGNILETARTCGEACAFKRSLRKSEGFAWDTSESASSNQPSYRGALELDGKEPNSRLQRALGRLSNDGPGLGSQAERRLNDSNKVEPGPSDSVALKKSPN